MLTNFFANKQKPRRITLAGLALIMALLYDLFFYKKELGIGFLLYVVIYLAIFLFIIYKNQKASVAWPMWLLLPIIILSADVAIYSNIVVQMLVPLAVLLLTILFSVLITLKNPDSHMFSMIQIHAFRKIGLWFAKAGELFSDVFSFAKTDNRSTYKKIFIGVFISIPFLVIFGILFAQADAVFKEMLGKLFDFKINSEIVWRVARTALFTIIIGTFLYVIDSEQHKLGEKLIKIFNPDTTIFVVVMILIDALFAMFVFIQIHYLFGSTEFILKNGMTYADYARSGFFQLVFVAVLSGILLMIAHKSFEAKTHKLITALFTFFVILVEVIGISALKRMNMYQDAYGYTDLRLYVEWFIYFIMMLGVYICVSFILKRTFREFFYSACAIGIIAFTIVASINVDLKIAEENIVRFTDNQKTLDTHYLQILSTDTVPAVVKLINNQKNLQLLTSQDILNIQSIFDRAKANAKERNSFIEFHFGAKRNAGAIM